MDQGQKEHNGGERGHATDIVGIAMPDSQPGKQAELVGPEIAPCPVGCGVGRDNRPSQPEVALDQVSDEASDMGTRTEFRIGIVLCRCSRLQSTLQVSLRCGCWQESGYKTFLMEGLLTSNKHGVKSLSAGDPSSSLCFVITRI